MENISLQYFQSFYSCLPSMLPPHVFPPSPFLTTMPPHWPMHSIGHPWDWTLFFLLLGGAWKASPLFLIIQTSAEMSLPQSSCLAISPRTHSLITLCLPYCHHQQRKLPALPLFPHWIAYWRLALCTAASPEPNSLLGTELIANKHLLKEWMCLPDFISDFLQGLRIIT